MLISLLMAAQSAIAAPIATAVTSQAIAPGAVPLAERPRGTIVTDLAGNPAGVIDASDATKVTLLIGTRKVQVPADAIRRRAGALATTLTSQQVEALMTASAKYQEKTNPAPRLLQPPKGFVAPARIASARVATANASKAVSPPPVQ